MDILLFGSDPEENIVAGYQLDNKFIRIYKRTNNQVVYEDREFYPFFFLSDSSLIADFNKKFWMKKLNGHHHFNYICAFHDWVEMKESYHFIIDNYKKRNNGEVKDFNAVLLKNDPVGQYLTQYGKTLFKGMDFKDIYRIQIEIFSSSPEEHEKEEITTIYLSDNNGWEHVIDDINKSEKEKIEEFIKIISEKDPDIIEGYKIYNRILPLLIKKCKDYAISLSIGRNNLEIKNIERITISEYEFEKFALIVPGRHLVDILDLVQNYEQIKKALDFYTLEAIAKHLNLSKDNKVIIRSELIHAHENKNILIKQYLSDNCFEIRNISEYLLPGLIIINRFIPYNLNRMMKLSHFQKIESILIREYLKQRQAMPCPEKIDSLHGGLTEIFYTGVLGPIVHAEIDLMLPVTIYKNGISPASDTLGSFKKMVEKLFQLFEEDRTKYENENDAEIKQNLEKVIIAYKILMNSFFGYISSPKTIFNSSEMTNRIMHLGKEMIEKITTSFKNSGGIIVEADPEEIYFIPPRDVIGGEAEINYLASLNKKLSDNITLRYNGRYRRMLSCKKNNYAFLTYHNKIKIKGSYLISKNTERFARKFIYQCIDLVLNNRIEELHLLYNKYYKEITEKKWDINELLRTETLKESLAEYEQEVRQGMRNRLPYYQLAVASGKHFKPGDTISFYIINDEAAAKRNNIDYETVQLIKTITEEGKTQSEKNADDETKTSQKEIQHPYDGCENYKLSEEWNPNFRDENITYYLQRLDEIAQKFQMFFSPEDFKMIFSPDDLFIYSSLNIKILTQETGLNVKQEEIQYN